MHIAVSKLLVVTLSLLHFVQCLDDAAIKAYRDRVRAMFQHAYDGYMKYAFPYDELQPLTCKGYDTWGSFSLTLIDSLDTLVVLGNYSEFQRVVKIVIQRTTFDIDVDASVFETNIRVVGGLLAAHLLSMKGGLELETGWPCSGPLLRLAEDAARRLLPAFETETGMPYGTINLRHGVPKGETPVTCAAGVGTFLVEFGTLSRLTGDPIFEKTAMRALTALWKRRSALNLVGNHIDVKTGQWTALDAGIGAGVDSYLEYLVKGGIMFDKPELLAQYEVYVQAYEKYSKRDDWYFWVHMAKGQVTLPIFQSLEAFWPGLKSLHGDISGTMKTMHNYYQVWQQFGFTPEFYNVPRNEAVKGREGYPLRPELVESAMYLYRATRDPFLLEVAAQVVESLEHSSRTRCGYAVVRDAVRSHGLADRMESFFLAETTKYLYLLFDEDNFVHNTGSSGTVIDTPNGECIVDAGGYFFNTEAHLIDIAAVECCSSLTARDLDSYSRSISLASLMDMDNSPSLRQSASLNGVAENESPESTGEAANPAKLTGDAGFSAGLTSDTDEAANLAKLTGDTDVPAGPTSVTILAEQKKVNDAAEMTEGSTLVCGDAEEGQEERCAVGSRAGGSIRRQAERSSLSRHVCPLQGLVSHLSILGEVMLEDSLTT